MIIFDTTDISDSRNCDNYNLELKEINKWKNRTQWEKSSKTTNKQLKSSSIEASLL